MEVHVIIRVTIAVLLACFPAIVFSILVPELLPKGHYVVYEGDDPGFLVATLLDIKSNIVWTLNGTRLEDLTNINYIITYNEVTLRSGALLIRNISADYNNTIFQSTVTYVYDNSIGISENRTLLVQGLLEAVGDLQVVYEENIYSLIISWTAPFSLIFPPATSPDISYCVNIVNETSNVVTSGECDIRGTTFVFSDVECGAVYRVVVIPVNKVGNGTTSTIVFPDNATEMLRSVRDIGNAFEYIFAVSGLMCNCSANIVEDLPGSLVCTVNERSLIVIRTIGIPVNSEFDIKLAIISKYILNFIYKLTTYDVQGLYLNSVLANTANFRVTFAVNSSAKGVLLIMLHVNPDELIDFDSSIYVVQDIETAKNTSQLLSLSRGSYRALAYDVERDGMLNSGGPAIGASVEVPGEVLVGRIVHSFPGFENCNVTVKDDMQAINVNCSFNNSVVAGYLVILQHGNLNRSLELHIGRTTDFDSTVEVVGIDNGQHYVTVFPLLMDSNLIMSRVVFKHEVELIGFLLPTEETSGTESTVTPKANSTIGLLPPISYNVTAVIAGAVGGLGAVIFILIISTIAVLLWFIKKKKSKAETSEAKLEEND